MQIKTKSSMLFGIFISLICLFANIDNASCITFPIGDPINPETGKAWGEFNVISKPTHSDGSKFYGLDMRADIFFDSSLIFSLNLEENPPGEYTAKHKWIDEEEFGVYEVLTHAYKDNEEIRSLISKNLVNRQNPLIYIDSVSLPDKIFLDDSYLINVIVKSKSSTPINGVSFWVGGDFDPKVKNITIKSNSDTKIAFDYSSNESMPNSFWLTNEKGEVIAEAALSEDDEERIEKEVTFSPKPKHDFLIFLPSKFSGYFEYGAVSKLNFNVINGGDFTENVYLKLNYSSVKSDCVLAHMENFNGLMDDKTELIFSPGEQKMITLVVDLPLTCQLPAGDINFMVSAIDTQSGKEMASSSEKYGVSFDTAEKLKLLPLIMFQFIVSIVLLIVSIAMLFTVVKEKKIVFSIKYLVIAIFLFFFFNILFTNIAYHANIATLSFILTILAIASSCFFLLLTSTGKNFSRKPRNYQMKGRKKEIN